MRSQYADPAVLAAYQESQLQQMLEHAASHVPYYKKVLSLIRNRDGRFDLARWVEIPIMSKQVVAANWHDFQSVYLPEGHSRVLESSTSGSQGAAMRIRKTRFEHTGVACASYRYANWFNYDYRIPLALIRSGFVRLEDPDDPEDNRWGPPWIPSQDRSSRYRLSIHTPVEQQLDWLMQLGPVYLNTLPSNAMALAQLAARTGKRPEIVAILTVGERLSEDIRLEVKKHLGCRISDVYATAECGLIAIECPQSGCYHIQSEISRVEVLKAGDMPCEAGETGHLVATSLYNFAMPIIRYRFDDLVTVGERCPCGRTLPTISAIVGRMSGVFCFADGSTLLPDFRTERFREIAAADQWQVAQLSTRLVEVRLPHYVTVTDDVTQEISAYVRETLRHPVGTQVAKVNAFARTTGGKFYPVVREFA